MERNKITFYVDKIEESKPEGEITFYFLLLLLFFFGFRTESLFMLIRLKKANHPHQGANHILFLFYFSFDLKGRITFYVNKIKKANHPH